MLDNLFGEYGTSIEFDGKKLFGFWSPEIIHQADEEDLRKIKLGYRAKTCKRQALDFVTRNWDENILRTLPTLELKKKLLLLYGVGPASVQYILFEVFKRYDVLEYIPPWERKIYSSLLFGEDSADGKVILDLATTKWKDWKMLAVHYIFEDLFWQKKDKKIT